MNEELVKSLTDLIEETINEIEDLKKSRFSASEVKLDGPGEDGIKGHSADGKLDKEEDKKDKSEDEKSDDKKEDKKDDGKDVKKGVNDEAEKAEKAEDKKDEKKSDDKKDDKDDDMDKGEKPKEGYDIKKSLEEHDSLLKSYIDGRVVPLETKLNSILDLVGKIAGQPAPSKGVSAKNFAALQKSADNATPLNKSEIAGKLFDLKKSGTNVDSADITAAELGTTNLQELVSKYNLK